MSITAPHNPSLRILGQPVPGFRKVKLEGLNRLQAIPPALPPFSAKAPNFDHFANLQANHYLEYKAFSIVDVDTMASIEILQQKAQQGDVDAACTLMRKTKFQYEENPRYASTHKTLAELKFNNLFANVQSQQLTELSELIQNAYHYYNNHNGFELLVSLLQQRQRPEHLSTLREIAMPLMGNGFISDQDQGRLMIALQAHQLVY